MANALATHTQRWARAYAEHGHEVHVLSIRSAHIPGVRVHPVRVGPLNSPSKIWSFFSYLYLLLTARHRLRRLQPDIVHAHFVPTHGVIAGFSGFHPVVLSVWGSDVVWHKPTPIPWSLRLLNRYALKRADLITATGRFLREQTRRFTPPSRPIRRIPFGVDCQCFTPSPSQKPPSEVPSFRIGFVKKLTSIYGPEFLIKALPRILESIPHARLIMAGREDQKQQLQTLAQNLGVAEQITFLGPIPHDDVPSLVVTFDVFVNPSICQESFGVSILEASACGVPVIATRVGGVPEVCLDRQTGILVPPRDPVALADAIVQLAAEPAEAHRMGLQGREFVLTRYQWQNNVEEMLKIFKQLIDQNRTVTAGT